ncbi:MAG: hypothetical protein KJ952_03570 [Candidatus Omnitrophica bacterium]|nr:hypothetical protein [Candidatus Omnitrophota bacterium]
MKIGKTTSIIGIFFIFVLVFFGYTYATKNLKVVLSNFLKKKFNTEFSIGYVRIGFPFCLELKDVTISHSVDIRSVCIYPNPAPFLLKDRPLISFVKIIDPVVRIKRGEGIKPDIAGFLNEKGDIVLSKVPLSSFYFSKIQIQNGTLIYDGGDKGSLEFVKIKGTLEGPRFCLSKDNVFRFIAKGSLKNKDTGFLSPLILNGYIESSDSISARIQANDIELDTLSHIYTEYLHRTVSEKGRISFDSDIKISGGNLIAKCFLEGKDVILREALDKKNNTPLVASFILLVNLRNNLVKIQNLRGNFLDLIFDNRKNFVVGVAQSG